MPFSSLVHLLERTLSLIRSEQTLLLGFHHFTIVRIIIVIIIMALAWYKNKRPTQFVLKLTGVENKTSP
jgi:hypothetical protein